MKFPELHDTGIKAATRCAASRASGTNGQRIIQEHKHIEEEQS
jgi:hypothetical protein